MKQKSDKGVAGLTILLSLIVMLFIIGLLVTIFALMGAELQEASFTDGSGTVINETVAPTTAGTALSKSTLISAACSITQVTNGTGTVVLTAGNYSLTGCTIANLTNQDLWKNWNVSYTYTYKAVSDASDVINDTTIGIKGVTDWFSIFIVIAAMVVLILLTVMIIVAIRGSGLMAGAGGTPRNVGSA